MPEHIERRSVALGEHLERSTLADGRDEILNLAVHLDGDRRAKESGANRRDDIPRERTVFDLAGRPVRQPQRQHVGGALNHEEIPWMTDGVSRANRKYR